MISGLNSSSVMGAIRTAGKARTMMDTMSRQLATGQRVSSVKDNGAAWTQAAALKSQQSNIEGRQTLTSILKSQSMAQEGEVNGVRELFGRARDIILAARGIAAGTQSRQALQVEFNAIIQSIDAQGYDQSAIVSGYGLQADGQWGIQTSPADPVLGGRTLYITAGMLGGDASNWISMNPGVPFDFRSTNISSGTDAHLSDAIWWATEFHRWTGLNDVQIANDQRWLDAVQDRDIKDRDRLSAAIGSLTDADLGKSSAALRQAETRQQLALSTVREAISAYGNFASGLLGNVQRTQRGLLA